MTVYKVTGSTAFMGHRPGDVFEADLDPDLERRALARGSIKKSSAKVKTEEEKEDGNAEAASAS